MPKLRAARLMFAGCAEGLLVLMITIMLPGPFECPVIQNADCYATRAEGVERVTAETVQSKPGFKRETETGPRRTHRNDGLDSRRSLGGVQRQPGYSRSRALRRIRLEVASAIVVSASCSSAVSFRGTTSMTQIEPNTKPRGSRTGAPA